MEWSCTISLPSHHITQFYRFELYGSGVQYAMKLPRSILLSKDFRYLHIGCGIHTYKSKQWMRLKTVSFGKDIRKFITLSITMYCGIDNIMWNILHIHIEYEEYIVKYCQSHKTILWILILLRLVYGWVRLILFCFLSGKTVIWLKMLLRSLLNELATISKLPSHLMISIF